MSIGVLIPVEKETVKGRASKTSTIYKCVMVKCNLDTEVEDGFQTVIDHQNTSNSLSK